MKRSSQAGLSLVETIVTLGITSGIMIIVLGMMTDSLHTMMWTESHNDLNVAGQRAVNSVFRHAFQAKQAFGNDAAGNAYRSALDIPGGVQQWSDTVLPTIEDRADIVPDTGTGTSRFTGNALLFAEELPPVTVTYDDDGNAGTPEVEFQADRYRFDYYFLARNPAHKFARTAWYLDLMESRSAIYADYFQLNSMPAASLAQLAPKLIAAGITRAWDPGQAIDSAFFELSDAVDGSFNAAIRRPRISIASTESLFPEFRGGRVGGNMDYSVAFRPPAPQGPLPIRHPLSRYAVADTSMPGFPSGFEVKIAGPSGSRKVMARVVLAANYSVDSYDSEEATIITAARF